MKEIERLMSKLIDLQIEDDKLPDLSDVDKIKFDHMLAIDHLYNSSKLEGSHLTKNGLEKAIYSN
jgi:hypothetical protein